MAKILVVDDNAYTRQMLQAMIVPEGHEVIGAGDGSELISLYEENNPDVVMIDVVMPDVDGITATKELIEKHPDAKVIIESAQQSNAIQHKAEDLGIVGFVPKPFDMDTITAMIKKALS